MVIALILSGGVGTRLGSDIPKQYMEIDGRPIISHVIETLSRHEEVDALQIVAASAWQKRIAQWLPRYDKAGKWRGFSEPGETRQLSVFRGLEDIRRYAKEEDLILIHDAARPLLSGRLITDCLEAAKKCDGAMPVLPMKDTVYASSDGRRVSSLLKREEIFAGQAPEVFLFGKYREANRRLLPEKIKQINGSTEPAVLAGMEIALVPGDEANFKITTRADLERFREILEAGKQEGIGGA